MGYYINCMEASFHIKKENFAPALAAIKVAGAKKAGKKSGGQYQNHWSWIDMDTVANAAELKDFLEEARWIPSFDPDGNITCVSFDGEKLGSEDEWLKVLAPWVESGSYIQCSGEEDAIWRWTFNGGHMVEVSGSYTWEDWEGMLKDSLRKNKELIPSFMGIRPDLDVVLDEILRVDDEILREKDK